MIAKMDNSVFDEGPVTATKNALEPIKQLAKRAMELSSQIESMEEALKVQKKALLAITDGKLPEMMKGIGITNFAMEDGTKVALRSTYYGSLPKEEEKRSKALNLIREYGGTDIIRTKVELEFGGSEDNLSTSIFEELAGRGLPVAKVQDVNAKTLAAFANDRMKQGEETDCDTLGVFIRLNCGFTAPRKKKSQ